MWKGSKARSADELEVGTREPRSCSEAIGISNLCSFLLLTLLSFKALFSRDCHPLRWKLWHPRSKFLDKRIWPNFGQMTTLVQSAVTWHSFPSRGCGKGVGRAELVTGMPIAQGDPKPIPRGSLRHLMDASHHCVLPSASLYITRLLGEKTISL